MKQSLLSILFAAFFLAVSAQEQLDFKVAYQPERSYLMNQIQITENVIKYIGSEEVLQNLAANGVQNPTIQRDSTVLKSTFNTGKLDGNRFSVEIEMLESTSPIITAGTKFFGASVDGVIHLDSIGSSTIQSEMKSALIDVMESMFSQIELPDTTVAVGDIFMHSTPISIPVGQMTMDMDIKSYYTLKEIKDEIGYFDLRQDYVAKTVVEGTEMDIEGSGEGYLHFDIEKEMFSKFFLETEMVFVMELEPFTMELKASSITDQRTEILKN
jgi:hypothetical protein